METFGIADARKVLGEIIDAGRIHGRPVLLTRNGKPRAVVVPVKWYEARRRDDDPKVDGECSLARNA